MTTNGIPTGPNNSSANVSPNVVEFINSDMPVPTPGQRDENLDNACPGLDIVHHHPAPMMAIFTLFFIFNYDEILLIIH